MRSSVFFWHIRVIVIASLILGAQFVFTHYVSTYFSYPDLLIVFFILILFHYNEKKLNALFITAFFIGIIQSTWFSQKIGIASFFYMIITFGFNFYKNLVRNNLQLLLVAFCILIFKFILYSVLSFIFMEKNVLAYFTNVEFLLHLASSLLAVIILGFPINTIWSRLT